MKQRLKPKRIVGRWGLALLVLLALVTGCRRNSESAGPHNPENELPFGHVDHPAADQQVGRHLAVAGWALDDTRIREVRVYADQRFKMLADINVDRPDVSKAYPDYRHGTDRHGWGAVIDLGGPGNHLIIVQAVDEDGATRDIASIQVTVVAQ